MILRRAGVPGSIADLVDRALLPALKPAQAQPVKSLCRGLAVFRCLGPASRRRAAMLLQGGTDVAVPEGGHQMQRGDRPGLRGRVASTNARSPGNERHP
jgi:hypothetical protein